MRKIFSQVYQRLDEGAQISDLVGCMTGKAVAKALQSAVFHLQQSLEFDRAAFPGTSLVIGMDEVGRGPLAGPLVAVCVTLPSPPPLLFLRDSKKLRASEREALVPRIERGAVHLGYGVVEAEEFGAEINLHHLTFLAMQRAIDKADLPRSSCALLVDGKFPLPSWAGPQKAVIKGDDTSFRIAAASVLAKVHRDRIMACAAQNYPQYGFAHNVGYGTAEHRQALLEHGCCPLHRKNFVQKILCPPLTEQTSPSEASARKAFALKKRSRRA